MPSLNTLDNMLDGINRLRASGKFDDDALIAFDAWEKQVLSTIASSSVIESDVVQSLVKGANAHIALIEEQLLSKTSDEMPGSVRDRLLNLRTIWQYIVESFSGVTPQIARIAQEIKDNLADIEPRSLRLHDLQTPTA